MNIKKMLSVTLAFVLTFALACIPAPFLSGAAGTYTDLAFKLNTSNAWVNGNLTQIKSSSGALLNAELIYTATGGKTMIPLRFVSEAFSAADVEWNQDQGPLGTAIIKLNGKTLTVPIGSRYLTLKDDATGNPTDVKIPIDYPVAQIINSSTYIPLRTVSEALACNVDYQERVDDGVNTGYPLITTNPSPDAAYFKGILTNAVLPVKGSIPFQWQLVGRSYSKYAPPSCEVFTSKSELGKYPELNILLKYNSVFFADKVLIAILDNRMAGNDMIQVDNVTKSVSSLNVFAHHYNTGQGGTEALIPVFILIEVSKADYGDRTITYNNVPLRKPEQNPVGNSIFIAKSKADLAPYMGTDFYNNYDESYFVNNVLVLLPVIRRATNDEIICRIRSSSTTITIAYYHCYPPGTIGGAAMIWTIIPVELSREVYADKNVYAEDMGMF